ncbi:MAG: GTP cyclohydrolase IIa [Desulfurococcales archaeon]|nr:GTP cyclohydrolase IIa [Desulfurococcales archaeon]
MVYAGTIEFVGYREWTESLGPDREWYIQLVQARLYEVVQSFVKDFNGMALPLRYDIQLIFMPSEVNVKDFIFELKQYLIPYSPTPTKVVLCCGKPIEVLRKCREVQGGGDYYEEVCGDDSQLVVAHADLNYFTLRTRSQGAYNSFVVVLNLVSTIASELRDKAIVQYLGGDNLVAITSEEYLEDVLKSLTSKDSIKIGVGISKYPRKAFEAAAKALSILRSEGRVRQYHIVRS